MGLGRFNHVYVAYPRGSQTGGPEALHQLVDALRFLGQEASLVPLPGTERLERVSEYAKYDAPEVDQWVDKPGNAVVVPEIDMDQLARVKSAQRVCWWLSVDKSIPFRFSRDRSDRRLGLGSDLALSGIRRVKARVKSALPRRRVIESFSHLAQSEYAWSYLFTHFNVLPHLVTDYIPLDSFNQPEVTAEIRDPLVAFNPRKGLALTSRVIELSSSRLEWVPLSGMTPGGVSDLLCRAAVYVDFGSHPGRDRLPREASLCGAVVVVASRGAGAFPGDVSIDDGYRLDPRDPEFAQRAARLIDAIVEQQPLHRAQQAGYRRTVTEGKERFLAEVRRAFLS